jgi:epoxide hydrolase-like predicted phosphatase
MAGLLLPGKVKAVLFDVGGVLFSPPQIAIAEVEREHGLPLGTLVRAFVSGEPNNAFCKLERGELTLSQFFPGFESEVGRVVESHGSTVPAGFSASVLFKRMSSSVRPVPAMIRAVDTLQQAGYKTGVITNNWIDDIDEKTNQLMTQFLNSHFDIVLQSCQLGIRKPNPLIYRLACHRLEVQPSQ